MTLTISYRVMIIMIILMIILIINNNHDDINNNSDNDDTHDGNDNNDNNFEYMLFNTDPYTLTQSEHKFYKQFVGRKPKSSCTSIHTYQVFYIFNEEFEIQLDRLIGILERAYIRIVVPQQIGK